MWLRCIKTLETKPSEQNDPEEVFLKDHVVDLDIVIYVGF